MTKITLNDVTNLNTSSAAATINANNAVIVSALDNTLSRNGAAPNAMESDLDMNGNDILNAGTIHFQNYSLDGIDFQGLINEANAAAVASSSSATSAATSASNASSSATAAASSATSAATSAANAAASSLAVFTAAAQDNTVDDSDELLYLTSSTPKRARLDGLVSSIFKTARTIPNIIAEAASFKWKNTGGFTESVDATALTANRTITLPDKDVNLGAVYASPVPYMKWGLLPENIDSTHMWFFNGAMTSPGGTATDIYAVQDPLGHSVIDLNTNGAGGLDTGNLASIANSTLYAYVIVHNTNLPANNKILMSKQLSAGSVTLPANFTKAVRIPVAFFYNSTFGLRPFHVVGGQPWGIMYSDVDTGGTMNLATSNATAGTGNYADLDASLWVPNNARWLELMTYINSSTGTGDILASTPGIADNRRIGTVSIANTDTVIHWKQRCSSVSVFQLQVPLNIQHSTVVLGYHMSDDC